VILVEGPVAGCDPSHGRSGKVGYVRGAGNAGDADEGRGGGEDDIAGAGSRRRSLSTSGRKSEAMSSSPHRALRRRPLRYRRLATLAQTSSATTVTSGHIRQLTFTRITTGARPSFFSENGRLLYLA